MGYISKRQWSLLGFGLVLALAAQDHSLAKTAAPSGAQKASSQAEPEWQPNRSNLPIQLKEFDGVVRRNVIDSQSSFPPLVRAPKGAPNVLIIMTDDVGFGASSTFGGVIPTPTMDQLAKVGLRYNTFHTTGLCSPTRAALLTGSNQHNVATATIPDSGMGFPGYTSIIPKSAATIAQTLKYNGYATSMFGKWHNVPMWEETPIGPYEHWPIGMGFEYSYFLQGGANEFAPKVYEGITLLNPSAGKKDYYFETDMTDHAIAWLRSVSANSTDKPFFMYYAPWAAHAGHQAPKEDIERFRGKFDEGWDVLRQQIFERQKRIGVIPADAKLSPRPAQLLAWDSLSPDQKKVSARFMEAFAAMLYHSDMQIGRLINELKKEGKLENTLVIYIQGDNGASGEGGLLGEVNQWAALTNSSSETTEYQLSVLEDIGGPTTESNYSASWAWAMNSPFQWLKQVSSHLGATRNGMVLSWPSHIETPGGIRTHFSHVIDVAPTILEAVGIPAPETVDGAHQMPFDGTSLLYSLDNPNAPERHREQYFEMFGNRGIYSDGWMASTSPRRMPWDPFGGTANPADDYQWELYDLRKDFTQSTNIAAQNAPKLKELQDLWWAAAGKNHVLPLLDSLMTRRSIVKPTWNGERSSYIFGAGDVGIGKGSFPWLVNRSYKITVDLEVPPTGADGIVATQGGISGGWSVLVERNVPVYIYALSNQPQDITRITASEPMAPGKHSLRFEFVYDGGGRGKGASGTLFVDEREVGKGRIPKTATVFFTPSETLDIGEDRGSPVVPEHFPLMPYRYTGKLEDVRIDVEPVSMADDTVPKGTAQKR